MREVGFSADHAIYFQNFEVTDTVGYMEYNKSNYRSYFLSFLKIKIDIQHNIWLCLQTVKTDCNYNTAAFTMYCTDAGSSF